MLLQLFALVCLCNHSSQKINLWTNANDQSRLRLLINYVFVKIMYIVMYLLFFIYLFTFLVKYIQVLKDGLIFTLSSTLRVLTKYQRLITKYLKIMVSFIWTCSKWDDKDTDNQADFILKFIHWIYVWITFCNII